MKKIFVMLITCLCLSLFANAEANQYECDQSKKNSSYPVFALGGVFSFPDYYMVRTDRDDAIYFYHLNKSIASIYIKKVEDIVYFQEDKDIPFELIIHTKYNNFDVSVFTPKKDSHAVKSIKVVIAVSNGYGMVLNNIERDEWEKILFCYESKN